MKKLLGIILALITLFSFTGCQNNSGNQSSNNTATKQEEKASTAEKVKIPPNTKDTGKGTITINTPSGTSENSQIPVIYVDKDTSLTQIGLDSSEFDGSKLSYILIDGNANSKEQLGTSQNTLTLKDNDLKVGTHKIEVVQFDNDKTNGNIVTYKTAGYEVKSK